MSISSGGALVGRAIVSLISCALVAGRSFRLSSGALNLHERHKFQVAAVFVSCPVAAARLSHSVRAQPVESAIDYLGRAARAKLSGRATRPNKLGLIYDNGRPLSRLSAAPSVLALSARLTFFVTNHRWRLSPALLSAPTQIQLARARRNRPVRVARLLLWPPPPPPVMPNASGANKQFVCFRSAKTNLGSRAQRDGRRQLDFGTAARRGARGT